MTIWIIEPHDPLIFRDGRPFGPNPGARAKTVSFPFPSTTAGGVRTRAGIENGVFNPANISKVKGIHVRGPLLVELTSDSRGGEVQEWMAPAPVDALLFERESKEKESKTHKIEIKQLTPVLMPEGAITDFDQKNLWLIGLEEPDNRKPAKDVPRYWNWDVFQSWLLNPASLMQQTTEAKQLGHSGPQLEQRLHVSIDPETGTARDGMLFETAGLEFTHGKQIREAKRLALAVEVDEDEQSKKMEQGLAHLGGERRIVDWRKSDTTLPGCPKELEDAIVETGACRMFLLTPAYFIEGYLPTQLEQTRDGVTPDLKAIAIQRPQVVSGWDLEKRKPKPTRRLAPAGTVLFLKLKGEKDAIRQWVKGMWMQCISEELQNRKDDFGLDDLQNRKDGFGLTVLGTWSGEQVAMKGK